MPKKYYVTTSIAYPNAPPHIGFAYELLIADFLARWHKLSGEDTFFSTGTDDHGQKLQEAAKAANKSPKQFVDDMSALFAGLAKKLGVMNNTFIRTTDKKHVKTAGEIFSKVFDKGLIYKGKYTGLYCTGCEAFYTEKDLIDGLCPNHKKAPKEVSEESYFFKMSLFQEQLVKHIEQNPEFIQPDSRRKEILNRLKEPLRDLSVSRASFNWGIPLPPDKKHVIYVWFDALLNYLSAVSYPTRKFLKYWPADCHIIGKDIIWFHTVIWPTILMASDIALPKKILVHGFLTHDGHKMSKSLGNVVNPFEVIDKYTSDSVRFVLLRDVPAGEDGDFSEANLVARHNGDLADSLGNLLQRTSVLIHKHFKGNIPICGELTKDELELNRHIPDVKLLSEQINNCNWNPALETIWNYIKHCNKYINDTQPWTKGNDLARLATILYCLVEHLRIISILVWPVIPESAEKLASQINQPISKLKDVKFRKTTKGFVAEPEILFRKFELDKKSDVFEKLNLKVGKIVKVDNHPSADKLFVINLDSGSERRQLVAGIKEFYSADELLGKNVVFLSNLKPANLRGVDSQGMILAAEKNKIVRVLESPNSKPGSQVFVEGISPKSEQIKIEDFKLVKITTKDKRAVYNNKELKTESDKIIVDIDDGAEVR